MGMEEKTRRKEHGRQAVIVERLKRDMKQYGPGLLAAVAVYFLVHAVCDAFCPSVLITGFPCRYNEGGALSA